MTLGPVPIQQHSSSLRSRAALPLMRPGCASSLVSACSITSQRAVCCEASIYTTFTVCELERALLESASLGRATRPSALTKALVLVVPICQPFAADYLPLARYPLQSLNECYFSWVYSFSEGKKPNSI